MDGPLLCTRIALRALAVERSAFWPGLRGGRSSVFHGDVLGRLILS
jgi:hypothetical protein